MGMKDVIGVDSFRIGDVTYTDADLASLPVERLEELKIKVNSDIIAISTQIKTAPLKPEGAADVTCEKPGVVHQRQPRPRHVSAVPPLPVQPDPQAPPVSANRRLVLHGRGTGGIGPEGFSVHTR